MVHRLPPLTALRAFEAAARHMSFAKAAEELFVTPAALSYQIKQLEQHLGTPLFRRLNRAVELTDAGRTLKPGVAEAFDSLHQATAAVERLRNDTDLTVTAGPAFTSKWLAPRLFRFANAHPEIELRFVASLKLMDFERDGVDAAIRYGSGDDAGMFSQFLADEWASPVCTPAIAAQIAETGSIADLPILHDESAEQLNPDAGWEAWGNAAGQQRDWVHGIHFTNTDHVIDAALEGGGLALGRIVLVERYLEQGRLEMPFKTGLRLGAKYRFVCPEGSEANPRLQMLLAWISEEFSSIQKYDAGMTLVDP